MYQKWYIVQALCFVELHAGRVLDPSTDDVVDVGLPFGPKPRLVLYPHKYFHKGEQAYLCTL
jgi:hypothetical protein